MTDMYPCNFADRPTDGKLVSFYTLRAGENTLGRAYNPGSCTVTLQGRT